MTDALRILPQPFPLLQPMHDLKHPRTSHMIMTPFYAIQYIPHLGTRTIEIVRRQQGGEVFWREMAEWTSVRILGSRLVGGQDLLAAES